MLNALLRPCCALAGDWLTLVATGPAASLMPRTRLSGYRRDPHHLNGENYNRRDHVLTEGIGDSVPRPMGQIANVARFGRHDIMQEPHRHRPGGPVG